MSRRLMICAGIDPASKTGMVALAVDADQPMNRLHWRWIDCATVAKAHSEKRSAAMNRLALYHRGKAQLETWNARLAVIERPADMGGFVAVRGGQKQRGQTTGTAFAIGESYGMLAAAAMEAGCMVHDYPVTSRRADPSRDKAERIGWMPMVRTKNFTHVQQRAQTLDQLHDLSVELRERPFNGVLASDRTVRLDENVLMALGVLRFHLNRQTRL